MEHQTCACCGITLYDSSKIRTIYLPDHNKEILSLVCIDCYNRLKSQKHKTEEIKDNEC
jgi:hypothetical protein